VSDIAEAIEQEASICIGDQARWRPSDESSSISQDTHRLCLMAKKQEQSLQRQEMFLISKLEELKAINERYEKLSFEHALVTNSSSSVSQLEKENSELKTRLDELSSKYNVLQANHVHLKC
jgi:predicted nuclease with TOPRIM domain